MSVTRRQFLSATAATVALSACGAPRRQHAADVREVAQTIDPARHRDGAGVNLQKTLGSRALPLLDPFLMLDQIHSADPLDWQAGFPDHPHRGFETVSYLITGAFLHQDSVGNRGTISNGGTQWMTAGRGIIHSEMPRQSAGQDLWGLQLWVNLPARLKMQKPRYQDLAATTIPELDVDGARVRLVAGRIGNQRGPVEEIAVAPTMLEIQLPAGGRFRHRLPATDSTFVQLLDGALEIGERRAPLRPGQLAVLGPGAEVLLRASATAPTTTRALILSAQPIGEPVARRGPFVMTTEAELDQAVADYRSGRLAGG